MQRKAHLHRSHSSRAQSKPKSSSNWRKDSKICLASVLSPARKTIRPRMNTNPTNPALSVAAIATFTIVDA